MTLCGSVLEGYDSASAPLEPEEDARLSTLPFSPPHAAVPPIPPPSILLAHSLPLSLRRVVSTLSPSRSIAFCVVFTLVSLFPIFPTVSPPAPARSLTLFPLSPRWKFFRLGCTHEWCAVSHDFALASPRAVSFADPFPPLRPLPPLLPRATRCPLPLHFHLTIILVLQILLAPLALSEETSAPARPVKFHYEINPGEYSYS